MDSAKLKNYGLWVLQIGLAGMFIMAGYPKLTGNEQAIAGFEMLGLGQWFRYFTGTVEVGSGILLLVPKLVPIGAFLLVCTMIGATIAHLTKLGGAPTAAVICGVVAAVILYGRRERAKALLKR